MLAHLVNHPDYKIKNLNKMFIQNGVSNQIALFAESSIPITLPGLISRERSRFLDIFSTCRISCSAVSPGFIACKALSNLSLD